MTASAPPLRVAAVESTPLVREGLRMVIESASGLGWLGATGDTRVLRANLARLRPDVVIVDGSLDPKGQLTRDLVLRDSALTVVILLGDQQPVAEYVPIAQAAGAHGLARRGAVPAGLVAAIRRAHRTRWFVDPGLLPANGSVPHCHRATPVQDGLLSARQHQVLTMIAGGMSSADIAEKLVVSPETVRTHIKLLLRRLDARDRAHAVARAYHLGVLSVPDQRIARMVEHAGK